MVSGMTRITVDVNDEWLDAAREVLGTDTKVATINAALHAFALRRTDPEQAWGYGGGRDLTRLAEDARGVDAA
jgi:hypothetical protein